MIEAQQAIPVSSKIGWATAEPRAAGRAKTSSPSLVTVLMTLIVALTVCGSSWVYLEGSQILKSYYEMKSRVPGVAGHAEAEFLKRVGHWQLAMTLVMAGSGGILILITAANFRSRRQLVARESAKVSVTIEEEWKTLVGNLRVQLAGKNQVEGDLLKEREQMRAQIVELSHAKEVLDDELNRRRKAEKSLSQQREELSRSKDVLEMHVRARTQELEKLQRHSELILNSAAEGICGFDLQGKITFVNPAAARIMGLKVTAMIGGVESELFPAFRPRVNAGASGTNGVHPTEVVANRPDGSTFAAEFIRSPIHENDRLVGEVLMFKDITERKQANETLAQRAAELARSNAELEQFAFVASHDLQEPLRKIQAFGDRLKTKCDEAKLEQGRDYLERMQSAAARMQTLINDLLTFSRVISRTEPFAPVDLAAVTREVLGDLEVRIEKGNAKLDVGELPTIEGDATQMRQLIQNLLSNALKFQPPGATPIVKIRAQAIVQSSARGSTVFFSRKQGEDGAVAVGEQFCELTVQDNGIGFEEKYLDKVFAVFQRLHGRQEYEGTGIGLAVCRRIVDRHGGTITARSKPGEGSTFIVMLPFRQLEQPKLPA